MSGHKQSGDINNPNNFENHKLASTDYVSGPLTLKDLNPDYDKYYEFLKNNLSNFNQDYYDRYAKNYLI
jgi:hypothetical protein